MSNIDLTKDDLIGLDADSRRYLQHQTQSWPVTIDQMGQPADGPQDIASLQNASHQYDQTVSQDPNLISQWQFQSQLQPHLQYATHVENTSAPQFTSSYGVPFQTSSVDLMAATQPSLDSNTLLDGSYLSLSAPVNMPFTYPGILTDLMAFPPHGLPDLSSYRAPQPGPEISSPTGTSLEVLSHSSLGSDNGWSFLEASQSVRQAALPETGFFINPSDTLHCRTFSDSSNSDLEQQSRTSLGGSFVEVTHPMNSPISESHLESPCGNSLGRRVSLDHSSSNGSQSPTVSSPVTLVRQPIPIPASKSTSPTRSSSSRSSTSPPSRKPARKSPIAARNPENKIRKQSVTGKPENTEKKIGKRKGPLKPDQRKQASEIRKLRACLRCKFLKKTCDKGEPCAGCQPAHARLWQVPCTRIDIKEIGYFMKDWKADYERHISTGISVSNIKGFSKHERRLYVTHGYGQVLPINAREIYVRDEECFNIDWVESINRPPNQFEVATARLSAGMEGISHTLLSDYLDAHIDGNGSFEKFVDDYFEGTPFLTQMLKTAFRYYFRTKLSVIRKALKLILAYNFTLHVTMVEGIGEEEGFLGKVDDEHSKFRGKTMAPVMINFEIKYAMASMWRELQKDVLEELSALYSSVYSGEKLKNWPTIFILASILLAVWEEMQFDCRYRVPDVAAAEKFCNDMESTPVGVIVGLFQAISQKLPPFAEWETQKHHQLLYSNLDVCNTMTEVREHVNKHENYLRSRSTQLFNRNDFDCLSNKFVSRLVIRAN